MAGELSDMPPAARLQSRSVVFFDDAPTPIMLIASSGRVLRVNTAWQRLWNISDDVLANYLRSCDMLHDPLMLHMGLQNDIISALGGAHVPKRRIFCDPGKIGRPGRPRHLEIAFRSVLENGLYAGEIVIFFRDVTERVDADEKARVQRLYLEAIVDHSPAAIYIKDNDGRYLLSNQECRTILGADNILGRRDSDMMDAEIANETTKNDAWVRETGEVLRVEEWVAVRGGQRRLYLSTKFGLRDEFGSLVAVCGISTDITEDKAAAEERSKLLISERAAREASELKSLFLAMISHEIRTPLAGIIGLTDLLAQSPLDGPQQQYARTIMSAAQGLLGILNDILDFSKLESGKLDFSLAPISLAGIMQDVEAALTSSLQSQNLSLQVEIAAALPCYVQADALRLRQVVLNLLTNAIKFSASGAIYVTVTCHGEAGLDPVIHFAVKDEGIGISPEDCARLFIPFTQVDASTARRFGGTGLGLAICKSLVEGMRGTIGVRSEPGRGSTFWFTLPLVAADAVSPGKTPMRTEGLPTAFSAKVLLAEDNVINTTVIVAMLKKFGLDVDAVTNGNEAVAAVQNSQYDLVLMDCNMPELDGYEATRRLRAASVALPIVALTANALYGDRERCLAAGMNDYLVKPLDRILLGKVLRRYLHPKASDAVLPPPR